MLGRRRFRWRGVALTWVLDADGQEQRRVEVGVTPYGAGTDTLINFLDHAIQPRFIEASANMVLADMESDPQKIPLLYTGGKVEVTNSCVHLGKENPIVKNMFDGQSGHGDVPSLYPRPG